MQDHTVAFSQSDWNSDGTGNVRLELENSHDPNNPYFTPMVRESKRTNFEKGQLKMGHLMDERFGTPPELIGSKTWTDLFVNHGSTLFILFVVVLVNVIVILERFLYYTIGDGGKYKDAIGYGIPLARASAASIKVNAGFILLTVCRNILSWLRTTIVGTYVDFDQNIRLHKWLAYAIGVMATVHVTAHFNNFYNIAYIADPLTLVQIGVLKPGAVPNTPYQALISTLPGATGMIITAVMVIMYIPAFSTARRPMFEVFWFTHHLFLIFYLVNFFHGAAGLLEVPTFWVFTIIPFLLYLVERGIRIYRGSKKNILLQAIQHESRVIELRFLKTGIKYQAGQYLFLQCSYLTAFEWHPFSISSSPEDDYVSVHIRIVGDWTGDLYKMLNPNKVKSGVIQENIVYSPNGDSIFLIDGPFGTAAEDVWKYDNVMIWCAGIGVTPFASVLKALRKKPIRSVEFYWTNRETTEFEWFVDLLVELMHDCPFIEIHLFFTGRQTAAQIEKGAKDGSKPSMASLLPRTIFSRPDIENIFRIKSQEKFAGQKVGVFFCGPPMIARMLAKNCQEFSDSNSMTQFSFHKENF